MPKPSKEDEQIEYEAMAFAKKEWDKIPTPVTDEVLKEIGLPIPYPENVSSLDNPENIEKAKKSYPLLWNKFKEKYGLTNVQLDKTSPRGSSGQESRFLHVPSTYRDLEKEISVGEPFRWNYMRRKISEFKGMKKREKTDLLGLYSKPEQPQKDLITFPSREEELKGLFGGIKRRKTRASKKSKKRNTRRTRK